jgi:chromosome segregation ATPase
MDKMEEIGSAEKQLRLKRIETYWAEHAEEKEALEQKKQALRQERDGLREQEAQLRQRMQAFDPNSSVTVPASSQMQKLQQQRTDAYRQMSSLGLFKGKEKKALAETIARLDEEIRQMNQQVTQQIAEKKLEIQKKRQELRDAQQELQPRLNAIETELKEIENELTKER